MKTRARKWPKKAPKKWPEVGIKERPRTELASQRRIRGAALPIVLLIASMMLVTSAAWFETSLASARASANLRDALQAFHAADSALTLCVGAVVAGNAPVTAAVATEPTGWKFEPTFTSGAFTPIAAWPGSAAPPQCLVEAWRLSARPEAKGYLLTARGFGGSRESQAWLQLEFVMAGDKTEQHWRRIAARPF
ncbi:PilX N-terminal domain-containing pilus assembly protein [Paraburkholderia sp. BCC1885]|uniref:pilus assembly PilX family protein n=1 Tax=Paraburkholderia sp. BCC1885 TaxID=2562669 RepID=UPI001182566B|nr:PilX N-terminal domain-containing pilus assembly protein [Paraburkholderia sp. BCC1885]